MAERKLWIYNLQSVQQGNLQPINQGETALKMQTRCVAAFPDKQGFALGSIEGRCSIAYIQSTDKNFAFKCHRSQDEIYAVNAIAFHPSFGTFATAGSDGKCFTSLACSALYPRYDSDNFDRNFEFRDSHRTNTSTSSPTHRCLHILGQRQSATTQKLSVRQLSDHRNCLQRTGQPVRLLPRVRLVQGPPGQSRARGTEDPDLSRPRRGRKTQAAESDAAMMP